MTVLQRGRSIPTDVDSVDKLLRRLALLSPDPVTRRGQAIVTPSTRWFVSPSLLRSFRCVAGCTACCLPFTLDFLPEEFEAGWPIEEVEAHARARFMQRTIEINGRRRPVWSYPQYLDDRCSFLRPTREGGTLGCGFWPQQPLECAAAPQLLVTTRGQGATVVMKRPFGRGWAWKDRPQCEFDPIIDRLDDIPDAFDLSNETGLLRRYGRWAAYFEIDTVIPAVIDVMSRLPSLLRTHGLHLVPVPRSGEVT
jgi:hypothetical protein